MNKEDNIKNELIKTTGEGLYNGWDNRRTSYGYHSYHIDDVNIIGQRDPKIRINDLKDFIDFKNKNILDLGCNVGAMLHHIGHELKSGIGIDYDDRCVDAAINISTILEMDKLKFCVHDFDKDRYDDLKSKIEFKPDIIFILSLGSWVKTWDVLYKLCIEYDSEIILETNNDDEGKPQIEFFEKNGMLVKLIIDNSKDDSTGNNRRKTYLIKKI